MTEAFEPTVYQANEDLRNLLRDEAAATRKYLDYKHKADEWDKYRKGIREKILAETGSAPTVKIGTEVVLTYAAKDQFSGFRFAAEYPTLVEEFTRVRAESYLDVDALRAAYPDIADRFTTRTFVNKAA